MSDIKPKMHQIRFRLGLCPRPGELTALPQTPLLDLRGPTPKGREGRGREGGKGGEGRGKDKRKGRGKGKEGKAFPLL